MIPDKCPKCGAGIALAGEDGYYGKRNHFRCGKSITEENHVSLDCLLDQVDQLTDQRDQLAARVKELEALNLKYRQWVRDAYEEGYWDGHDRKQFDEAINTSEAVKRLDGRAEP